MGTLTSPSRRRANAVSALIVAPIILFIAAVKAFEPHGYAQGDIRNEQAFWIIGFLAALGLAAALMVGSIRALMRDRSDPPTLR